MTRLFKEDDSITKMLGIMHEQPEYKFLLKSYPALINYLIEIGRASNKDLKQYRAQVDSASLQIVHV